MRKQIMAKIAISIFLVFMCLIAYGFWESSHEYHANDDIQLTVKPIFWSSIKFGSGFSGELESGAVYLELTWNPYPSDSIKIVSKISVKGKLFEGNKEIESFNRLCEIGGTSFLADEKARISLSNNNIGIPNSCYIKLNTKYKFDLSGADFEDSLKLSYIDIETAKLELLRLKDLELQFSITHKPFQFVASTKRNYRKVINFICRPFNRVSD
jgi:hypothetical protein